MYTHLLPHRLPLLHPPSYDQDERQTIFLSDGASPLPKLRPSREEDDAELTFTNVPFEEHKLKRGGAKGAGGSQTKWYS